MELCGENVVTLYRTHEGGSVVGGRDDVVFDGWNGVVRVNKIEIGVFFFSLTHTICFFVSSNNPLTSFSLSSKN